MFVRSSKCNLKVLLKFHPSRLVCNVLQQVAHVYDLLSQIAHCSDLIEDVTARRGLGLEVEWSNSNIYTFLPPEHKLGDVFTDTTR